MGECAIKDFSITRSAIDPRADGARRVVHVSATHVTIERVLQGVRMRIGVPVAAYRDLVIGVRAPSGSGVLRLRHDDPDLSITLAAGEATEVARQAQAWGALFERQIGLEDEHIDAKRSISRRRRTEVLRNQRFSRRRQVGVSTRLATSFAGEHEIIARD